MASWAKVSVFDSSVGSPADPASLARTRCPRAARELVEAVHQREDSPVTKRSGMRTTRIRRALRAAFGDGVPYRALHVRAA